MVGIFALVFFGILVGVSFLIAVGVYNGLVGLRKQVDRSWANIDVILKQRHDEIPQLIQIIEQYTAHENAIIEKVAQARTKYQGATQLADKINASNEMTHALRGVLAIGEAYPELRSSNQFAQLQGRLSSLEDQLADRREFFNDTITTYNTRIEQFPDMFFAQALGYPSLSLFKINDEEKTMPSLKIQKAA